MQMNGLAELITIARYWREWSDPRLVVAVLHNNDLNQVTWELRAMGGTPTFVESQALPDVVVRRRSPASIGLGAVTVTDPDELAGAWRHGAVRGPAVRARRPLRPRRAAHPAARRPRADDRHGQGAASRATPAAWGVIKEGIRTKAQELLPHRD